MNQKAKLKLKKQLKHKQNVKKFYKNAKSKYNKQLEYQAKHGKMPAVISLGYLNSADTTIIAHNYDFFIGDRVKLLSDPTWVKDNLPEDKKDNRTILANLNYMKTSTGHNVYAGIVIGYRFVNHGKNHDLYILLKDVYSYIKPTKKVENMELVAEPHFATDHLWIPVKVIDARKYKDITIGLGDSVAFYGKVIPYRGKRENIEQTKYGLTDEIITDNGYPKLISTDKRFPLFNNFLWSLNDPIHYKHRDYLIHFKLRPTEKNPLNIDATFGNQWRNEDKFIIKDLKQEQNHKD